MFASDWIKSFTPTARKSAEAQIKEELNLKLPWKAYEGWIESDLFTVFVDSSYNGSDQYRYTLYIWDRHDARMRLAGLVGCRVRHMGKWSPNIQNTKKKRKKK